MAFNFSEYWSKLCETNPGLADADSRMTISVGAFKRQIEKAYWQGGEDIQNTLGRVDSIIDCLNKAVGKKD